MTGCKQCKFFVLKSESHGQCRRHSPRRELVRSVVGVQQTVYDYATRWPETNVDGSCGDGATA